LKTSIHLSRSKGYRELGMFDESILELEEIEGEDRWHPSVVEARYNTYRDAKEWELAKIMAEVMVNRMPDKFEWLKNQADAMTECGDPTGALQLLHDSSNAFGEDAQYIFALGRQYALLCEIEESKKYVKREIKMDSSLKAEFLDDPAFDAVWDSF
jgi:predicted Zn-dependent protease